MNKFQSLYCIDESATKNDFSILPEDVSFYKNQSVISKLTRYPQVIVSNHSEKQGVFANNKVVPGEASYAISITTAKSKLKKSKQSFLEIAYQRIYSTESSTKCSKTVI